MAQNDNKQAKPVKVLIRAVHGLMIHPYTHAAFNTETITPVDERDAWLDCQIEAGKLETV